MRIRKRTPARAASPPPPLQQPTEKPREEEDKEAEEVEEEKPATILAAGEDDDRVRPAPAAAAASGNSNSSSAAADVPKPEPQEQAAAAAVRCSRNDGKRWRCKKAAARGYLFCDRHIAWSTRKRKPRASKPKTKGHGSGVMEPTTTVHKDFAEGHHREAQRDAGFLGGF